MVTTTDQAHKSGIIFHIFQELLNKNNKIKDLLLKMTKIASRGSCHFRLSDLISSQLTAFSSSSAGTEGRLGEKLLTSAEDDTLLLEISGMFYEYDCVHSLAARLLDGVEMGGHAFLQRHFMPGVVAPSHAHLTHNVLRKWIEEKPREARRGVLFDVLLEVYPLAADTFQSRLLG